MSNVISGQFFKAGKLKSVKVSTIAGICFAALLVLMARYLSGDEAEPVTGMGMFGALSQSYIYFFILIFANHILSVDWTISSIKQILGKGTDRVKYCIGSMIVAAILTFVHYIIIAGTGTALGTVLGSGLGAFDIKSFGFSLGGFALISVHFTALIMLLYCFIKKSAAVIMIVSFLPIISDLVSMFVIGMTGKEFGAYLSYFTLMDDILFINPDSTQNVIGYSIFGISTIIFVIAAALVFRKEDIN